MQENALGFKIWRGVFNRMPKPHNHNDIEINFLLNGWVKYIHGGQLYEIQANEFTVFWGGIPHNVIDLEKGLEAFWITMPLDWLIKWNIPGSLTEKILSGQMIRQISKDQDSYFTGMQLDLWLKEFNMGQADYNKNILLELESKFRRICQSFEKTKNISDNMLQKFHKPLNQLLIVINENYLTLKNTDELGKQLNLHPKYLMQIFKKHTNMNLWDYILHLRVAHAQRLLITTNNKIIDICFASGFQSNSSFYYIFEKFNNGTSPAKYRKFNLGFQKTKI
jgi:AraC-like DNA-binding protein